MEAGRSIATNRLSKASVAEKNSAKLVKSSERASSSKGRKRARIRQDESSRKNLDRMRISRSDSENIALDTIFEEGGSKSIMVTPNAALPTQHEESTDGQFDDQDKEAAVIAINTIELNKSRKISRIPEKERHTNLKARLKELREENHRLCLKLQEEAVISLQLKEKNKILLDELKQKCKPDIIKFLEAKNPDQISQPDDDESS